MSERERESMQVCVFTVCICVFCVYMCAYVYVRVWMDKVDHPQADSWGLQSFLLRMGMI